MKIINHFNDLPTDICLLCNQALIDFSFNDGEDLKCEKEDHYFYFNDDYNSVEIYLPHFTIFYTDTFQNINIIYIHDVYNNVISLPLIPLDFSDISRLETKIQKLINFL